MAYYSNLEKKINEKQKKPKFASSKMMAIILTIVATVGYFSLFTNLIGFLKHFLLGFFGIFAYALFSALYVVSGLILKGKKYDLKPKYIIALSFALLSLLAIFHMAFSGGVTMSSYGAYLGEIYNFQASVGGLLLGLLAYPLQKFLNFGAYILFAIILVICVTIIYNAIAEAKALGKVDFKFFRKKDNFKSNAQISKPVQTNVVIPKQEERVTTITIETSNNDFKTENNNSVGLNAHVERELTKKEIARQKLGLDRTFGVEQAFVSNTNQLDTFNHNYMNAGGSVMHSNERDYTRTFGYNSDVTNRKTTTKNDDDIYKEYRKFMGLADVDDQPAEVFSQKYSNEQYQNQSNLENSTISSDEKLFGEPKSESPTKVIIDYDSPAEKVSFMDKLTSDNNEEIAPAEDIEIEEAPETSLNDILDDNLSDNTDLPKGLQSENIPFNHKYVSPSNPIDAEITKMKEYSKPVEAQSQELPKVKLKPYHYTKPTLDLLSSASTDPSMYGGNVEETGHKIESVLEDFKIPAKIIGITRGPAVTRYELEMPIGISVNKVPALESDIAMRIATTKKIRIEAPIPGMNAFGIEVPNDKVATVSLKELLASDTFILSKSPCSFALGKEINGQIDICQVNKMPHVLIAGSTGSGKSVCLNSLVLSILYKSSPEDVKFILIDPKRVEFSIYAGLPHLVIPDIISEPRKADNALGWAVKEMEKRYMLLEQYRVRNIDEFNNMQEVKDRFIPKMPYIIIIMDEFADIMQSDCKDIENKVMKLAAKARAAGIHLVLATQRPSVDVLSGTAKNNFTARIAFFLTSQTDSRTILGYGGAENLLGKGDMLYVAPGSNEGAKRLQGCFVSDEEVKKVVDYVITHNEPDFDQNIADEFNKTKEPDSVNADGTFASFSSDGSDEEAEMHEYARIIMKEFIRIGKASTSHIQRTQRVGFNKAGRIIDYLERKKYIAPGDGSSKPRAVYMTKQQYIEIFGDTDFDNHD